MEWVGFGWGTYCYGEDVGAAWLLVFAYAWEVLVDEVLVRECEWEIRGSSGIFVQQGRHVLEERREKRLVVLTDALCAHEFS